MDRMLQNYYTEDASIKEYMINMLDVRSGNKILEPCGGTGELIDGLINLGDEFDIDTFEINHNDVNILRNKYKTYKNIHVIEDNTLVNLALDKDAQNGGFYDRVIGNPPYGGWLEYADRDNLSKKYKSLYVKETYLLFLVRCLSVLKDQGKLTFIIPDTYLYLRSYKKIRDYILTTTQIEEVLIFPSKLFAGIHFGYSNLSIITVKKNADYNACLHNIFKIVSGFRDSNEFVHINLSKKLNVFTDSQQSILRNNDSAFILDSRVEAILNRTTYHLDDFADCVTGIYTGNNKKYLALSNEDNTKKNKGYNVVSKEKIDFQCTSLKGIVNGKTYIPIVKGSSDTKYTRTNYWVIKWRPKDIAAYHTNKKARFQNFKYYFRLGIALPMVKSKKIKATVMNQKVFDQSIVGIFPFKKKYYNYLLGLFNSEVMNHIIHVINPTANNSANYLKRIPILLPTDVQLELINKLVGTLIVDPQKNDDQAKLEKIYEYIYQN